MKERTGIIFNIEIIKYMAIFTRITQTSLKDCINLNSKLMFIVEQNQAGKAIGKKGINVKKLENTLKKKLTIVEFNPDAKQFIGNIVYPNRIKDITEEDNIYTITPADPKSRSMLIGRNAVNLREYENMARRYFDIKEIKVK